MHGLSTMYCNVATEVRMAGELGFDAVELVAAKLIRYLDVGYKAHDLVPLFEKYGVRPVVINALQAVERVDPNERAELMAEAHRLCEAAEVIGCPTIQLVPLCSLAGRPYDEIRSFTARNIAEIADIGKRHGIRFQIEPIAFSPIHSLSQSLELIHDVGRDNVGMVIDFWHLYAGGETTPQDVARLDASQVYGVHFCDGVRHTGDGEWDELSLRAYLPGEGEIPIQQWVDAVKSTGFDGVWSSELVGYKFWEMDLDQVARTTKALMEKYVVG
jgi:sugar phosphate isomerase/epimerase